MKKQKLSQPNINAKYKLPVKAKGMFNRRFKQALKRTDEKRAEKQAISFVKTRYKKVKGKWIEKNANTNK